MERDSNRYAAAILVLALVAGCSSSSSPNPKLVSCLACGHLVSRAAPTCPQCGQPNPSKEAEDAAWDEFSEVGKDVLVATECSVENNKLTSLTLTDKWPVTTQGLRNIGSISSLRYLSLHSAGVTDEGLLELKGLRTLVRLDLQGSSVTSAGLGNLSHFPKLSALSLGRVQLTNADFTTIRALPGLEHLTLCGPGIPEAVILQSASLPQVKYLHLRDATLSDNAIKQLKAANPKLSIIYEDKNSVPKQTF